MLSSGGGGSRSTALTGFLLVTLGVALVVGFILFITFLITLFTGTTITWVYALLWVPWGLSTGVYLAATVDSKQMLPFFLQHSVTAALLSTIGLLFNIIAGYFYIRLWFACVPGWGNLDDVQKIMCSDEEWVIWVTSIASGLVVLISLGQALTAAYDAFVRISGSRVFSAAQQGFEKGADVFGDKFRKTFSRARRGGKESPEDDDFDNNDDGPEEENLYPRPRRGGQKKKKQQKRFVRNAALRTVQR